MRKEIWELGGSVMEGGEKQEERKNTKEEIRGRNGTCRLRRVGGGGGVDLWEELNYKFAPKISCDKLPLHP